MPNTTDLPSHSAPPSDAAVIYRCPRCQWSQRVALPLPNATTPATPELFLSCPSCNNPTLNFSFSHD